MVGWLSFGVYARNSNLSRLLVVFMKKLVILPAPRVAAVELTYEGKSGYNGVVSLSFTHTHALNTFEQEQEKEHEYE